MQHRRVILTGSLFILLVVLSWRGEVRSQESQETHPAPAAPRTKSEEVPLPPGATYRLGSLKFRHLGQILCVAYSPDGKVIATGGDDRCVRLWDPATGKELRELPVQGRVTSVAFSPDGQTIAAGEGSDFLGKPDQAILIWRASTGREIDRLPGSEDDIRSIAYSPDGNRLVVAAGRLIESTSIHCWDLKTRKKVFSRTNEPGAILTVAFSPDGKSVIVGAAYKRRHRRPGAAGNQEAERKVLRVLDGETGEEREGAPSPNSDVYSLTCSPDGKVLATGHRDGVVRFWDLQSGGLIRKLEGHTSRVWSLAFSPDGWMIAAGADDSSVRIWGVRSGVQIRHIKLPRWYGSNREKIRSLSFSPDGKRLAAAGGSTALRILDPSSGKLLWETPGHQDFVTHAAFSPDGRLLATVSGDRTARIWDLGTGEQVAISKGHELSAISVAFAPDGKSFVTGSMDEKVRQWEVPSGRRLMLWNTASSRGGGMENDDGDTEPNADRPILALGFAADGTGIVTSAGDDSVFLLDRDTPSHEVLIAPDGYTYSAGIRFTHRGSAFRPDFNVGDLEHTASVSADGRRVAYVRHGTAIRLLDVTLQERWKDARLGTESEFPYGADGIHALALDGSGSRLAFVRGTGTLEISEMLTGKEIRKWQVYSIPENVRGYPDDFVLSVTWSPDGKTLSTSDAGGSVRLWDVARGEVIARLRGHVEGTLTTTFSPDGERLASCGFDSTALVWDIGEALSKTTSWDKDLGPEDLDTLWEDLGGADAARAFDAIWILGENPEASLPLLKERVASLGEAPPKEVRDLVKRLDEDDFAAREEADKRLRRFGADVEGTLGNVLEEGEISPEVKVRLQAILKGLTFPMRGEPGETLRTARACLALERIGTAEAVQILKRIEKESRSFTERSEATAALRRLASRPRANRRRNF